MRVRSADGAQGLEGYRFMSGFRAISDHHRRDPEYLVQLRPRR